tara:strand:+ start:433 stop:633 length:201 start_codon:yes stop_codon:yes gene_type:complete
MAKTVRLSDTEEAKLIKVCLKINRELVKMGKMPLKDTEIFHEIMKIALINGEIEISRNGEVKIIIE